MLKIGGYDIYDRRAQFERVIQKYVSDPSLKHLFAMPYVNPATHGIDWYVDLEGAPVRLSWLKGQPVYDQCKMAIGQGLAEYRRISKNANQQEREFFDALLQYSDALTDDMTFLVGNTVVIGVWGISLRDPNKTWATAITTSVDDNRVHSISFSVECGALHGKPLTFIRHHGYRLNHQTDIPDVIPNEGYEFKGWEPDDPHGKEVLDDMSFKAVCVPKEIGVAPIVEVPKEPEMVNVYFDADGKGTLSGAPEHLQVPAGTILSPSNIPLVTPNEGYKFKGWNFDIKNAITKDITIKALYKSTKPKWWYKWLWPLLIALIILLLLLLFGLGLKRCCGLRAPFTGCTRTENVDSTRMSEVPSTPIDRGNLGRGIDPGNGDNDYHAGVQPYNPEDIVRDPDGLQRVAGMLNIFFEDDNADLNKFARDFRTLYADTIKYKLDYDDLVKRITVMMPDEERPSVRNKIDSTFSNKYNMIIVDEYLAQMSAVRLSQPQFNMNDIDWHLRAVNASKAWENTMGDSTLVVAVVDDGCDMTHPMFSGKIVKPYNVFTKSREVTPGQVGHGTHVAGLAVGNKYTIDGTGGKWVQGLAPRCKLMPVQVFPTNSEYSSLSAQVSGVVYAIHHGAQVVNMSIGVKMEMFRNESVRTQEQISDRLLKEMERVWKRVARMAQRKNVILVYASGNDHVISALDPHNRTDSVMVVTSVNKRFRMTDFTNYGKCSMLSAPGDTMVSAGPLGSTPGYALMKGTSMSAPIVAGIVALMRSVNHDLTQQQVYAMLKSTGKSIPDDVGPMVQADLAVQRARSRNN
ncbi:MAG: S8 family serine peptidase [Muribaculaceae bacterium]|nr:S8 family serine peptidase [Muribaculaceae bacterium]